MRPFLRKGKPDNIEEFNVYTVEGITMYINKNISFNRGMIDNFLETLMKEK